MEKTQATRFRLIKLFRSLCILSIFTIIFACSAVVSIQAQTFEDLKTSPVDYSKADISPAKSCETMGSFKADDIIQLGAKKIPAEGNEPGFCKVRGILDPEIAFEVNLPEKWNGRFYMIGNGGHAGQSLDDPMQVSQVKGALSRGFAVALTNTGHDARKEPGASFVMSNPQKAIDYAYRAVHLTAVTAKAITADYYQKPLKYSYWNSCSNGGR